MEMHRIGGMDRINGVSLGAAGGGFPLVRSADISTGGLALRGLQLAAWTDKHLRGF